MQILRKCAFTPMWTRPTMSLVLIAAITITSSCDRNETPTEPLSAPAERTVGISDWQRANAPSLDDRLNQVAARVPGFGGFVVRDDSLVIFLTNPAVQEQIAKQIVPELSKQLPDINPRIPVAIKQGRFEFRELTDWHRRFGALGIPPGVEFSGVLKERNELTFGVTDAAAASAVRAHLASLGIPAAAYTIEFADRARPATLLTDRVRPTDGGFRIANWTGVGLVRACTLGLNVWLPPPSTDMYLITASHCTAKMNGADTSSSVFYQPSQMSQNVIGKEAVDPGTFTGGSCPANKVCRWSDAALIKYDTAAHATKGFAALANSSLTVTGYARFPDCCLGVSNTGFYKTGMATGTTTTSYSNYSSCLTYYPDSASWAAAGVIIPGNLALLCHSRLTGIGLDSGDSGGPLFLQGYDMSEWPDGLPSLDKAQLRGFAVAVSGTYRWFSYHEEVMTDLGGFYWKVPY